MTFDEARKLLGVSAGYDQAGLRRAYLSLLKKHKPESDPEGFMRLREAFEMLRGDEPSAPAREVTVPPAQETDAPDADAAEPEPPEEAGDPDPPRPWETAIDPSRPRHAARVIAEWLSLASTDPKVPRPPVALAVHLLLVMMRGDALARASRLHKALRSFFGVTRISDSLSPEQQATWALASSLWNTHELFSEEDLLEPVAGALLQGDPRLAGPALYRLTTHSPDAARQLRTDLEQEAPELLSVFGGWLVREELPQVPKRPVPVWPFVVGLMMLGRLFSWGGGCNSEPETPGNRAPREILDKGYRAIDKGDCAEAERMLSSARTVMYRTAAEQSQGEYAEQLQREIGKCKEAAAKAKR